MQSSLDTLVVEEAEQELAQVDGLTLRRAAPGRLDDPSIAASRACVVGKYVVGSLQPSTRLRTAAGAHSGLEGHALAARPPGSGEYHRIPESARHFASASTAPPAGQIPTGGIESQTIELYLKLRLGLVRGTKERRQLSHSTAPAQFLACLDRSRRRSRRQAARSALTARAGEGAGAGADGGATKGAGEGAGACADGGATKGAECGADAAQASCAAFAHGQGAGPRPWVPLFPSIDVLFLVDVASRSTEAVVNRTAVREAAKDVVEDTEHHRHRRHSKLSQVAQQILQQKRRLTQLNDGPGGLVPDDADPTGFSASFLAGHITDHCFSSNLMANAARNWWVMDVVLALLGRSVRGGEGEGVGRARSKGQRRRRSSTQGHGSSAPPSEHKSRQTASHPLLILLPVAPGMEVRRRCRAAPPL